MNWILQNRFLTGLIAFFLVGTGAFAFLILGSWNRFREVAETYQDQKAKIQQLQGMVPYPDNENLTAYKQQQQLLEERLASLHDKLSKMQLSSEKLQEENVKPEQFQDQLRAAVSSLLSKSEENKVSIPDKSKFYLGFGQYQAAPPKPRKVPGLLIELKSMEWLANLLISSRVEEIGEMKIDSNEEEAQPKHALLKGGRQAPSASTKRVMEIGFTSDPAALRAVLNAITNSTEQFLILRDVRVQSTQEKGPSRQDGAIVQENQGAAVPGFGMPSVSGTSEAPLFKFVVGNEKIKVLLKVEIFELPKEL